MGGAGETSLTHRLGDALAQMPLTSIAQAGVGARHAYWSKSDGVV